VDRLAERLADAARAVATLHEVLREPFSVIVRDAAIKRFEYTFEAVWKAAQLYLSNEGFDVASPRGVVRTSVQAGLLTLEQAEGALVMVDDRNLTVHLYKEAVARQIFERLPGHAALLRDWLAAIQRRYDELPKPR
jgi:nucleotidyltransferase substrate binding protein (TIGR01987 family)